MSLYAGTPGRVFKSADGGATWTPIPGGPIRVSILALDPQDPNTVYAGGSGGLWKIRLDLDSPIGENAGQ